MKSCLIIEDSKVVRTVIKRIVERFGFESREAENGQEGFDFCCTSMPDIAIVDQYMPAVSGTQFLEKLKDLKPPRLPLIIFCSADNNVEHIKTALDKGADEYIMKPFDGEIMRAKFTLLGLLNAEGKSA
ncbi:MAG: response regulator [Alphaproteobacteria bacterium]